MAAHRAGAAGLLRPSVKRSAIRTAIVDQGPVDATLSATGTVVPQTEQVLSSPVDARLLRVIRKAGTAVQRGRVDCRTGRERVGAGGRNAGPGPGAQGQPAGAVEARLSRTRSPSSTPSSRSRQLQLESARLEHERNRQLFAEGPHLVRGSPQVGGRRAPGRHRAAAHRSIAPQRAGGRRRRNWPDSPSSWRSWRRRTRKRAVSLAWPRRRPIGAASSPGPSPRKALPCARAMSWRASPI